MWQKFTKDAQRLVFYSQEEAGHLGENHVSTEHLLLALLREDDWSGTLVLKAIGCDPRAVRTETERRLVRGGGRLGSDMQLTPRAKRVIDLSYDECTRLGAPMIDTEHLLLGLIREGEGLAGLALVKCGADLDRARDEVKRRSTPDVVWPPPPQIPGKDE